MKKVALLGCGSEIGVNLLLLNQPESDGFIIDYVLTKEPSVDMHFPNLHPIHGIYARLKLAYPADQNRITIIDEKHLAIDKRIISFEFLDIQESTFDDLLERDAAIIATSKQHIQSQEILSKVHRISSLAIGAAESEKANSIYPCLLGLAENQLSTVKSSLEKSSFYCVGSCQTNGMHASLRAVIHAITSLGLNATAIQSIQTDIIHPDTPTGMLGTSSFEGRQQDCRNNLRPSFTQMKSSIPKVLPWINSVETVSLRAPVTAPGYQINRFIVNDDGLISRENLCTAIDEISLRYPYIVSGSSIPLGSRAYAFAKRCSTILTDSNHLIINRPDYIQCNGLSEIIIQSYVNNTIGYAVCLLKALQHLLTEKEVIYFEPKREY